MGRYVKITIQEKNLLDNLALIRSQAPKAACVVMLKADAYGHGLVRTAKFLESYVDLLGVSFYEFLREHHLLTLTQKNCLISIV